MQDLFPEMHSHVAIKLFEDAMFLYRKKEDFKKINRALRKSDRLGSDQPLEELNLDRTQINTLKTPDQTGTRGIHPIVLRNIRSRILKMKSRLFSEFGLVIDEGKLTSSAASTLPKTTHEMCGEVRIVDNVETGRIQLFFPRKVRKPTTNVLKYYGFRWSQAVGAWQHPRDHQGTGLYWARRICRGWNPFARPSPAVLDARFALPSRPSTVRDRTLI